MRLEVLSVDYMIAVTVDSSTELHAVDNVLATQQKHAHEFNVGNESIQAVVTEHYADKLDASCDASWPAAMPCTALTGSNAFAPRAVYGCTQKWELIVWKNVITFSLYACLC